jgi:hypothetical protein
LFVVVLFLAFVFLVLSFFFLVWVVQTWRRALIFFLRHCI